MSLFDSLGFRWDRTVPFVLPIHSIERAAFRFHRMLPEFVWDASMLEGNPFSYPEVKTLLDGVTVGGRRISDQEQVLNLAAGSNHLLALVRAGTFSLDKATFTELQSLVAHNEVSELGCFRSEGKGASELNRVFEDGLQALQSQVQLPFEKAVAFFLFGALHQFFSGGNKRTARMMMNGALMSAGVDAISVPAARAREFNEKMARFRLEKDAAGMMAFLIECHPDKQI